MSSSETPGLIIAADGRAHCFWRAQAEQYQNYHDHEWGRPVTDDIRLFEKICLEGFQSGLSWITILRKRENFRKAFHKFDPEKIACYGKRDVERLLKNDGIIRSRAKIEAAIRGAKLWLEIQEKEPGGFTRLIWKHVDGKPRTNRFRNKDQVPAQTEMSEGLARELKTRGFNFCGPVIIYAFAQATGMVNDHLTQCFRHAECAKLGKP